MSETVESLQAEIISLKKEIELLNLRLQTLEPKELLSSPPITNLNLLNNQNNNNQLNNSKKFNYGYNEHEQILSNAEIRRYGRQLILQEIGIEGQKKLKNSKILIVGAGGLGAPSALYLAAAGVGKLGIVDHDIVDASNLHRQIIHTETREGMSKALSAKMSIQGINSFCECQIYHLILDSSNAIQTIEEYDLVLDCTDNVATRYLINDACVLLNKPLVSGSALRFHGQLTIYNFLSGPCYRCLYPTPPPPETVTNCSDGGVMGPVVGVIGSLQAMEAIKIITGHYQESNYKPTLLLYSANREPAFQSIKLRSKQAKCHICSSTPQIVQLIDYTAFCGSNAIDKALPTKLLSNEERISAPALKEWFMLHEDILPYLLLDVRDATQFQICKLHNSYNIPLAELDNRIDEIAQLLIQASNKLSHINSKPTLFITCRLGNDSQLAVKKLKQYQLEGKIQYDRILDLIGGLYAWSTQVDDMFPIY